MTLWCQELRTTAVYWHLSMMCSSQICKNTGMEGGTKMFYFNRSNEHFRYLILHVSLICTLALMLSPAPVVWKSLMSWPIMCSRPYPRIFSAVWLHHTTWSTANIFFHQPKYFWFNIFLDKRPRRTKKTSEKCTRGGKGDKSGGQSIQRILREWIEMSEKY